VTTFRVTSGIVADLPTKNGRTYPRHILEQVVDRMQDVVERGQAFVTLDGPITLHPPLSAVAGKIEEMRMEDDRIVATIRVISTPRGEVLKTLLEDPASPPLRLRPTMLGAVDSAGTVFHVDGKPVWTVSQLEVGDDPVLDLSNLGDVLTRMSSALKAEEVPVPPHEGKTVTELFALLRDQADTAIGETSCAVVTAREAVTEGHKLVSDDYAARSKAARDAFEATVRALEEKFESCPSCGCLDVEVRDLADTFPYGDPVQFEVHVTVPEHVCLSAECGFAWTDYVAEGLRDGAVAKRLLAETRKK
jgi:hypothetical protein